MTQIMNPARLTQKISFGTTTDEPQYDENDRPLPSLKKLWTTLGAPWQLTTNQMIQSQGLNLTQNKIFAVRHRPDRFWHSVDSALINGQMYEVVDFNLDPTNSPTSYDLITVRKVEKHG